MKYVLFLFSFLLVNSAFGMSPTVTLAPETQPPVLINTYSNELITLEFQVVRYDEAMGEPAFRMLDANTPSQIWGQDRWWDENFLRSFFSNQQNLIYQSEFWQNTTVISGQVEQAPAGEQTWQQRRIDTMYLRLQPSRFTDAFWQEQEERHVLFMVGTAPKFSDWSHAVPLTFKRVTSPPVVMLPLETQLLTPTSDRQISVPMEIVMPGVENPPLPNFSFAWQRSVQGVTQFWNGQQWQTQATFVPFESQSLHYRLRQGQPSQVLLELDGAGNEFWDGQTGSYQVQVSYHANETAPPSAPVRVQLQLAPPAAPTIFEDELVFRTDQVVIKWSDPGSATGAVTYDYKVGIQRVADGTWLDPDWWDHPIRGDRLTATNTDPLLQQIEPQTAYRILVYRLHQNGTLDQHSLQAAETTVVADLPALAGSISLAGVTLNRANHDSPTITPTGEEIPFHLVSSQANLGLVVFYPNDGATSQRDYYFGLRSWKGEWLTPDWRRLPFKVSSNRVQIGLNLPTPMTPHAMYDLVMATGDRHSRSEVVTLATVTYDNGVPHEGPTETRPRPRIINVRPPEDYAEKVPDIECRLQQRSTYQGAMAPVAGIIVNEGETSSSPFLTEVVSRVAQPEAVTNAIRLVFRLYEPRGDEFEVVRTSLGTPLSQLAGPNAQQRINDDISALLTYESNLPWQAHPSSLTPRPLDQPYRLCAFFVHSETGLLPPDNLVSMLSPYALPLKVELSFNGNDLLPIFNPPKASSIQSSSIPVHFRITPEYRLHRFVWHVENTTQPFVYHRKFPGQTAVNFGDTLVADAVWQHAWRDNETAPPQLQGSIKIYRRSEQGLQLTEVRNSVDRLVFDETFDEGASYRIVFGARDRFNLVQQVVQDIAAVRQLNDTRFVLAFGGRTNNGPFEEKTAVGVYGDHQNQMITSYTGTRPMPHQFVVRAQQPSRRIFNPDTQQTELRALEDADVSFRIAYVDPQERRITPSGRHTTFSISDPAYLLGCQEAHADAGVNFPKAPYPIEVESFQVRDNLTHRVVDFGNAKVDINFDPQIQEPDCPTADSDPTPVGAIALQPSDDPLVWHYGTQRDSATGITTSTMFDFEMPTTLRFDGARYQERGPWHVGIELRNPVNHEFVYVNMPLVNYLQKTGQSLPSNIAAGSYQTPFLVVPSAFGTGTTSENAQAWWVRLGLNTPEAITEPKLGGQPLVYVQVSIFENGANPSDPADPRRLATSNNAHGGGIPLLIELGEPTFNAELTALAYQAVSPNLLEVVDGDTRRHAFTQTMLVNNDLSRTRLLQGQFYWQLRSRLGYFDGTQWTATPTPLAIEQTPFLQDVTLRLRREESLLDIQATLNLAQLPAGFWQGAAEALNLHFELSYQPAASAGGALPPRLNPANPADVETYRIQFFKTGQGQTQLVSPTLFHGGADIENPLSALPRDLPEPLARALHRSFAPEPLVLEATRPGVPVQQTWVLSAGSSSWVDPSSTPSGPLAEHIFAWLTVDHDPSLDNGRHQVFIAPYPEHLLPWSELDYALRTPITLNHSQTQWTRQQNCYVRFVSPMDTVAGFYQVIVFVPHEQTQPEDLATLPSPAWATNDSLLEFLDGNPTPGDWGTSQNHNRIVNVSYPDPTNPSHRIVGVQFWDLTGRAQETRTMATHAPIDWLDHVAVEGAVTYDAFGRVVKAAKGFPLNQFDNSALFDNQHGTPPNGSVPQALTSAGTIEQTFAAGQAYWLNGSAAGGSHAALDHVFDRADPYVETVYEEDATRSRVLATLPPGRQARDQHDVLRFNRHHHALVPTYAGLIANRPQGAKLVLDGFQIGNNALAQKQGNGNDIASLSALLQIDANGLMSLTLANRVGTSLVAVANPSVDLLRDWGFNVQVAAPGTTKDSIELDNGTVWLPKDFYDRIDADNSAGTDLNLVSLSEVDDRGLVVVSHPPKALRLYEADPGVWAVSSVPDGEHLSIRFQYDALARQISIQEPDAGETEWVYDRHGRKRLSRDANDRARLRWSEQIFDAMGRIVEGRVVTIQVSGGGEPDRQTLQAWFDDESQAPGDYEAVSQAAQRAGYTVQVVPGSTVRTQYDQYQMDQRPPSWATAPGATEREQLAFWPSLTQLEAAYPWPTYGSTFTFGRPNGQVVEIASQSSAERFYYDIKGRPVCHVMLLRGVLEPQVLWQRYDNRDLMTATYNQTHHLGSAFVHDAFGRIVQVHDITPFSERMRVMVSYRQGSSDHYDRVKTLLGPLVDTQSSLDLSTRTLPLAERRYTPSGHVTHVRYGHRDLNPIESSFTYDIRDWLLSQTVTIAGEPAYSVKLDHIGINDCFNQFDCESNEAAQNGDILPMYDGSIAVLSETYHLEGESGRQTRHEYRYDGIYQIAKAVQHRRSEVASPLSTERLAYQYRYDRNGNRTAEERRNVFSPHLPLAHDADLKHVPAAGKNRLASIEALNQNNAYQTVFQFDYDDLGNVSQIDRYPALSAHGDAEIQQALQYDDPRHTHQPTQITQIVLRGSDDESAPFQSETRFYRYNHTGTRTYRAVQRGTQIEKETYFVPAGTENAVTLDGWGRARRAYLFSGSERIGYKSNAHTAAYIKDHLGSTKMVVALYRPAITTPEPAESTTAQSQVNDAALLTELPLDEQLTSTGLLSQALFAGDPSYFYREGGRALWLDHEESLQFPNHAAVEGMTEAFTISLWLYDADEDDGSYDHGSMVTVGNQLSIRYNPVHFYLDGQKLPVLRLGGGPEGWQFFSRFSRVPNRTWTHLAVTFDGTHVRCYQNGELLGEPDPVTLSALWPAQDVVIGNWLDYDGYAWHGGLDEILIRSDALSQQEIRNHYLSTKNPLSAAVTYREPTHRPNVTREALRDLLVVAYSDSDAFGIPLAEEMIGNALEAEPHTFTGQEMERGTGLVYMNGRWYLPEAGRFLQVDPMRQYWNSYSYTGNNPINRIDPTGLADDFISRLWDKMMAALHGKTEKAAKKFADETLFQQAGETPYANRDDALEMGSEKFAESTANFTVGIIDSGAEVTTVATSVVIEPYDWFLIFREWSTGNVSPFDFLAMAPLLSHGAFRTMGKASELTQFRLFWRTEVVFEGNKVFQRNDLFDPNLITTWKVKGKTVSGTNVERMATGRAPVGFDGKAVNLHHLIQTQNGAIAEVSASMHQRFYSIIHINTGQLPSGIERKLFDQWRKRYWKARARTFHSSN